MDPHLKIWNFDYHSTTSNFLLVHSIKPDYFWVCTTTPCSPLQSSQQDLYNIRHSILTLLLVNLLNFLEPTIRTTHSNLMLYFLNHQLFFDITLTSTSSVLSIALYCYYYQIDYIVLEWVVVRCFRFMVDVVLLYPIGPSGLKFKIIKDSNCLIKLYYF